MDADLERAETRLGRVLSNKWTLEAVLGVGGMAAVYRAVHRNGSRVAIKLLHPEMSLDTTLRERFLREGYAANKIQHEGVVKVIDGDADTTENTVYLVMELLEGEALETRLKRKERLALGEALSVGYYAADALVAAHAAGIIHRDIKPDNLFLTMAGQVKILDFGLARLRERSGMAATQEGSLLGTPAFMPPEQATGRWSQIDARADVWSLGATIFSLISGRNVHEGRTAIEHLVAVASKPARSLASVAPQTPPDVIAVIDKALAFRPEDRHRDMATFRDALARASSEFSAPRQVRPSYPGLEPPFLGGAALVNKPRPQHALAATVIDPHALGNQTPLSGSSMAQAALTPYAPNSKSKAGLVAALVFLVVLGLGVLALAWHFFGHA